MMIAEAVVFFVAAFAIGWFRRKSNLELKY